MYDSRDAQVAFVQRLVSVVPEFTPIVDEHKAYNGEVLPHVLFGDFTRWIISLYRQSKLRGSEADRSNEVLARALSFLEDQFAQAKDKATSELIAASFLENLDQADADYPGMRQRLGPALRGWLHRLE